ncbi:MAG: Na+/H+ antiporter NhaA, partial [Brevundimonas sp.]|nr:Na+/H+ antiporter NhaA [Brevundimonas sp.]
MVQTLFREYATLAQPRPTHLPTAPASIVRQLAESSSAGGIVLMVAAALAMLIANSPASGLYFATLNSYVGGLSVLHWINDALMAIFFLFVGLEIKRELVDGRLSTW